MPGANTYCWFTWPITITAPGGGDPGTNAISFRSNAAGGGAYETVSIAAGTYFWRRDSTSLGTALNAALSSHTQTPAITVTLSNAGYLTIASNQSIEIDWGAGATTVDETLFGATAGSTWSDVAGPFTVTSPWQVGHAWIPEIQYVDDSGLILDDNVVARSESMAGAVDVYHYQTRRPRIATVEYLFQDKIFSADAAQNEAFDLFYSAMVEGNRMEWTRDVVGAPGTYAQYMIATDEWLQSWPVERPERIPIYHVSIPMIPYV